MKTSRKPCLPHVPVLRRKRAVARFDLLLLLLFIALSCTAQNPNPPLAPLFIPSGFAGNGYGLTNLNAANIPGVLTNSYAGATLDFPGGPWYSDWTGNSGEANWNIDFGSTNQLEIVDFLPNGPDAHVDITGWAQTVGLSFHMNGTLNLWNSGAASMFINPDDSIDFSSDFGNMFSLFPGGQVAIGGTNLSFNGNEGLNQNISIQTNSSGPHGIILKVGGGIITNTAIY